MVQPCLRESFLEAFESCEKSKINRQVSTYVGNIGAKQVASPVHYHKGIKQPTSPHYHCKGALLTPKSSLLNSTIVE